LFFFGKVAHVQEKKLAWSGFRLAPGFPTELGQLLIMCGGLGLIWDLMNMFGVLNTLQCTSAWQYLAS